MDRIDPRDHVELGQLYAQYASAVSSGEWELWPQFFTDDCSYRLQPRGTGAFDFVWTHFGFEDDSAEMTQRRLRQANLFGPAGFVSADDGEVIELSQKGFEQKPFHRTLAELGGREVGDADHMVTETLIRGMYAYWRRQMED